jgi:hypothetical protein
MAPSSVLFGPTSTARRPWRTTRARARRSSSTSSSPLHHAISNYDIVFVGCIQSNGWISSAIGGS